MTLDSYRDEAVMALVNEVIPSMIYIQYMHDVDCLVLIKMMNVSGSQ